LFPLSNLPTWLTIVTHVNPMTYAVEPMRSIVFDRLGIPAAARAAFDPGISWGGWHVPVAVQVSIVVVFSLAILSGATALFSRTE
jgi:ABC-2 type transport system permease protein